MGTIAQGRTIHMHQQHKKWVHKESLKKKENLKDNQTGDIKKIKKSAFSNLGGANVGEYF